MQAIMEAIDTRSDRTHRLLGSASHILTESQDKEVTAETEYDNSVPLATPPHYRPNPEPPGSGAPLGPSNERIMYLPAGVSGLDAPTPTPGGGVTFNVG
jgi:tRNA-dihydrouridine synthase 2